MPWGRLLERTGPEDTGSAEDWTGWAEPRCGWLEDAAAAWSGEAHVAPFTTPEGGWDALSWAVSSAQEELLVALYDLTSRDITSLLAARAAAGVRVRLLLEGQPVGASTEELAYREGLLAGVVAAGGEVTLTVPADRGERHRPYRYHHEKCCVVDDSLVVVTTENWGASSFPPPGGGGAFASRGWGAVIRSRGMASFLSGVIEHDMGTCTMGWTGEGVETAPLPIAPSPPLRGPSLTRGNVSLLVGPEAWGPDLAGLLEVIGGATYSVELELACLDVRWGEGVSPLVEALFAAAGRGAMVRVLLDGGYDGEGAATARELLVLAARRGAVNVTVALADGIPGVSRLHAKGAVIDGRRVVMGSLNWAWSSVARNRELLVVIDSEPVADVFSSTFRSDWGASATRSREGVPLSLVAGLLQGRPDSLVPASFDGPVEVDTGGDDASVLEEEPLWRAIARAAVVVAAGAALWTIEARYGVKARISYLVDRRWRRLRRRWGRLTPLRAGPGAPGARRTIGPGRDRARGSPPVHPPPGPPPPDPSPPDSSPPDSSPPDPPPLDPDAASW
jgi:phosphatidylserine/phosphatidylglycerophosphate/cardiolipin synthase-like enzyme